MKLKCPYCNHDVEFCSDNRGRVVLLLCYTCDHCFRRASNTEEFEICPVISQVGDKETKCPLWLSTLSSQGTDSANTAVQQLDLPFIT